MRHDDTSSGQSRSGRSAVRVALRTMRRGGRRTGRSRDFRFNSQSWRSLLRCDGRRLNGRLSGRRSGLNRSHMWRNRGSGYRSRRGRNRSGLIDSRSNGRLRRNRRRRLRGGQLHHDGGLLSRTRLLFADWRGYGRLDHHRCRRRSNNDNGPRRRDNANRCLGDHRTGRGAGGNCWRRWRTRNDGRRRAWLRNDFSRFWPARRCWRRCDGNLHGADWRWRRSWRAHRRVGLPRILLLFLLVGQNGLHHVSRLGNVGEIDFWSDGLRSAGGRGTRMTARSAVQMHANLFRLVFLQGT